MKAYTKLLLFSLTIIILGMCSTSQAQVKPFGFGVGMQFCYSPGFKDHLDNYKEEYGYNKIEGGGGWIGPQFLLRYRFNEMFLIDANLGFLFNYVQVEGHGK
ncbi:MAG: hypothetical protein EOM20_01190 [Spartobacteria bacterium]|nr:hypothetical protein [Spartobacteria bacterium]